jgi:hypothetical protein
MDDLVASSTSAENDYSEEAVSYTHAVTFVDHYSHLLVFVLLTLCLSLNIQYITSCT